MNVFEFRDTLVKEYGAFSRSFTKINASDIKAKVDAAYSAGRYWPDPIVQLNPNFRAGPSIDQMVSNGKLHPECKNIFRLKTQKDPIGEALTLYQHQADAIEIAQRGESFVIITGTGSGKSLGYFIPIVDSVLRRGSKGIAAIVVYPMNALCNSQTEELEKYLRRGYPSGKAPVTFARYTGQESEEDRARIAKNPPDILLTNYVMLELIMTRFIETDKAVRSHAQGLRFLVLDELHSYRGRQGADIAMLVRRVRERFNAGLLCIGTSATMASETSDGDGNGAVADVASTVFGARVTLASVVTESLDRVTVGDVDKAKLRQSVLQGHSLGYTYTAPSRHPVAIWVELRLGLEDLDGKKVRTRNPLTVMQAVVRLAQDTKLDVDVCRDYLVGFLLAAYQCRDQAGRSLFAFRLHQFISGAWNVYASLDPPGGRYITLEGQQFKPGDRTSPLFCLSFCRECGQEYFPVWTTLGAGKPIEFSRRDLFERSTDDEDEQIGYLMPGDSAEGSLEDMCPEEWLESKRGLVRIKSHYRKYAPIRLAVDSSGKVVPSGMDAWYVPRSFRFCLKCLTQHSPRKRSDIAKLSGLSGEGRSSATTVLVLSALKYLIGSDLDPSAKKLLGFTDNRQDASFQAGHFNDFVQILLLRGALLSAIQHAPAGYLTDDVVAQCVTAQLRLDPADYSVSPRAGGRAARKAQDTLTGIIGHRLYVDLRRGWRVNNPNLEQLNLLHITYADLEACCGDVAAWADTHPVFRALSPDGRMAIARELLDRMLKELCIKSSFLDYQELEKLKRRSYTLLKEPWALAEDDQVTSFSVMVPRPRYQEEADRERRHHVSYRSTFGAMVRRTSTWGDDNPYLPTKRDESFYNTVVDDLLRVLRDYGIIEPTDLKCGRTGYYVNASVLEWRLGTEEDGRTQKGPINTFFCELYRNVAKLLDQEERLLHQLEAREHTAQVDSDVRQERERRFRSGLARKNSEEGLPIMFCTPTMELGVDIASLNAVYMRNVPPTPANYAQRSGRAGRSGQPALVVTYCAARSPHDQYFFSNPARVVAGIVSPPAIDVTNEDLVRSHIQAVWLSETGVMLSHSVAEVLDVSQADELPITSEIDDQLRRPQAAERAILRVRRIMETIVPEFGEGMASWYADTWVDNQVRRAQRRLDEAFDRWRTLFRATVSQKKLALEILDNFAASERERKEAKTRFDEAQRQQNLLLYSRATVSSDFYSYRYLASEGFLPGYNFPRLPLLAYIPGRLEKSVKESFLSRPRFLGLSEFGPGSIIYHEGSTYRVERAILSRRQDASNVPFHTLPVTRARICLSCGYGHFVDQQDFERCVHCDALLGDGLLVERLYCIEQVSTRRITRITSDEEERRRLGYDIVTTVRFSQSDGRQRVETAVLGDDKGDLLELSYAPAATLWRINLGWRRRKVKSIHGFHIDARNGRWAKGTENPDDPDEEFSGESTPLQRITPFVRDTRNVLIVRPLSDCDDLSLVTVQYALKRGIEQLYQLEENELAVEPLPNRDLRNAILLFESSEGGAGVLSHLVHEHGSIQAVAQRALQVCHYRLESAPSISAADLEDINADCEAGCYRCLLSYYNQLDHGAIDRKDDAAMDLLCRLVGSRRLRNTSPARDSMEELLNASGSSLEKDWLQFMLENHLRLPSSAQHLVNLPRTRADFYYEEAQALIYIDGPHHLTREQHTVDARLTAELESAGFVVIRFSLNRARWLDVIRAYPWVFGATSRRTKE